MGRKELREHIFKMLFAVEFNQPEEMAEQLQLYFENFENMQAEDRSYIQNKFEAIAERIEEIDSILNEYTTGWKTTRMNKVDLTLLRLAVYEVKWDEDVPVGVAINEAVELAKKFSSNEGPSFINGVLAKIAN